MNDLLELALKGHGGLERWKRIKSIEVTLSISGQLLEAKGFSEPLLTTVLIDADHPHTVMQPYGGGGRRGVFTPERVWIEAADGAVVESRDKPRASFAGHVRETPWDQLHRLYFLGYAMWDYLTIPFLLTRPGFELKELELHSENRETWRVLEVSFPDDIPAHCRVQRLYLDAQGLLKRLDYQTDILGGVAAHYCYDPKTFSGLVFPTRRRVVKRTPEGSQISGITAVFLDYTSVQIHDR